MKLFLFFALCLMLLPGFQAQAAPVKPEPDKNRAPAYVNTCKGNVAWGKHWINWFDWTQNYLSERVCGAAVWFDQFFSTDRDVEENVDRFVRLTNSLEWSEKNDLRWRIRLNARIQLPQFKERVNLILSDSEEDEREDDVLRSSAVSAADEENKINQEIGPHSLGLRWNMVEEADNSFSTSIRLRLNKLARPLIRARYRYTRGVGENSLVRFTQTLFWRRKEGVGETSRVDLERLLAKQSLLRWANAATYSETSEGWEWNTTLSLLHSFSAREALSFEVSAEGLSERGSGVEAYRTAVRYRRNIFRKWLFLEVEPALTWARDEFTRVRDRDASVTARLEMHFGRKKH